jgi:hypothetical protein
VARDDDDLAGGRAQQRWLTAEVESERAVAIPPVVHVAVRDGKFRVGTTRGNRTFYTVNARSPDHVGRSGGLSEDEAGADDDQ